MTEQTRSELARRLMACPNWRWMPGMKWIVKRDEPLEDIYGRVPDDMRGWAPYPGAIPLFENPATMGCLLALYHDTRTSFSCTDRVYVCAEVYGLRHPLTIEALVAALEAAP